MQRLAVVDTGMNTRDVVTMEVPGDFSNQNGAAAIAQYERMQRQLQALPGVTQVGLGSPVPLRTSGIMLEVKAEDRPLSPGQPIPQSEYRTASPNYFKAAGIPLLRGKEFTDADRAGAPRVVILNKTLADLLFGDVDPIGRRVAWSGEVLKFINVSRDWRTVLAALGNTNNGGLDAEALPALFLPLPQCDFPTGSLVIRSSGNTTALAPAATRIVRSVDPKQPIEKVMTVDQIRDESVGPRRLNAQLVASFGLLALSVAAIGIAAVLACPVSARRTAMCL